MTDDEHSTDYDDVLAELRQRVERRRLHGDYPAGLEEDLNAHFDGLRHARGGSVTLEDLRKALEAVRASAQFGRARIGHDSSVRGGELVQRAIAKAVSREIDGVFQQLQQFSDTVGAALAELVAAYDHPPLHVHSDVVGSVYAIQARLAAIERRLGIDEAPYEQVLSRLDQLEERLGMRTFAPPYTAAEFGETFHGDPDARSAHHRALADRLAAHEPVVDIGCGRGELLAMLRERQAAAEGVELDAELARQAVAAGLVVHHADGIAHLDRQPDRSLGAIVAIHVAEQLHPQQLVELVTLAARKLRPGGQLVIETPNVQSLYVHAHAFWIDPSHLRFVHPAYLTFLVEQAGFESVETELGSPPPESDRLLPVGEHVPGADAINEDIGRLNRLLFEARDVLLVATR